MNPSPFNVPEITRATSAKPQMPQADTAQQTHTPMLADAALHGLAGEIVRAIAPHTEAHPAALLGALLTAFGCSVGRGAWMNASGNRHFANEFLVIVGRTSRARKSTAASNVRAVFEKAGTLPPTASGLSSGEGLIEAIRDAEEKCDGESDDADEGVTDKRLLVIEGELARALAAMKREGNTLSAVLREAWDGSPLRTLVRRKNAVACRDPHVALIACVTGEELRKRLEEVEVLNGLGNRILWLLVDRPHLLPHAGDLPWAALAPLLSRLADAVRFSRGAGELSRTPEADRRWEQIYLDLAATNHSGPVAALTDRAEAHVLRLGMIFALLDVSPDGAPPSVETLHLDAALAVWRFCEASVVAIFGGLSRDARNIAAVLNEAKPDELSRDEISSKTGKHTYGERLDTALAELVKAGRAKCRRDESTGGRPRELWRAL